MNPYKYKPDYCFWNRAMLSGSINELNLVTKSKLIGKDEKISTMGSCFAQHISNHLKKKSFNYYIAEDKPKNNNDELRKHGYGIYSARYGNIYTVRQAYQLFLESFGKRKPSNIFWKKDKYLIDALRPNIEGIKSESIDDLIQLRMEHLRYVKDIFLNTDWLIFTLGLTECWQSKYDNTIFPFAPGVYAGNQNDQQDIVFKNLSCSEVIDDLFSFITEVKSVNKKINFLLTVSPVPLIATYEDQHVYLSTTYSKSILRVAAEEATRNFNDVYYFPSYELITSPMVQGRYYEDNFREVNSFGVSHAMKMFENSYINSTETKLRKHNIDLVSSSDIQCDEELITKSIEIKN